MTIIHGVATITNDSHHGKWIQETGCLVHDKWTANQICQHLRPGDLAIDCGANIGTLTRAMIDAGASVVAFEPNPDAYECLTFNCPEATAYQLALGETTTTASMMIQENAGASYVVPGPGSVEVVPLDGFNLAPRLIKMDCEGFEINTLRGAADTIARCKPIMVVEVNPAALSRNGGGSEDELLTLIEGYGYQWRILQPQCSRGSSEQYDVVCLSASSS